MPDTKMTSKDEIANSTENGEFQQSKFSEWLLKLIICNWQSFNFNATHRKYFINCKQL